MHNRSYIIHLKLSSGTHTHTHTHTISHSLPLVRTMDDVTQTALPNCKQFQVSTAMCLLVPRDTVRNTAKIISCPSFTSEFQQPPSFHPDSILTLLSATVEMEAEYPSETLVHTHNTEEYCNKEGRIPYLVAKRMPHKLGHRKIIFCYV